jgi:Zn-dependent metalloprotease
MHLHRCQCHFVPPFVLENMSRKSVKEARLTAKSDKDHRERRREKKVPMSVFAGATAGPTGDSIRQVYDCGQQWVQRVNLVRAEGAPATGDADVTKVYDFAGNVRDFFTKVLNRKSIDNAGMNLVLNVHFGTNYMNAFWDGDEMTFGDGDGAIFTSFAKSLDVVGHELAHGVTQFTGNLDYYSQAGALNEHFSDVFGSAITQHVKKQDPGKADWLIGDEIMGPTLYGESLRSMKAPGTAYDNSLMGTDPQPDHMSNYFAGPEDNQGVHINSGIPNRAFYLTAIAIGTEKATRIWYHALQNLWPTADFASAVDVIVESARLAVKNGDAPAGTTQTVRSAFKAVGL